jgi:hypothetical protein
VGYHLAKNLTDVSEGFSLITFSQARVLNQMEGLLYPIFESMLNLGTLCECREIFYTSLGMVLCQNDIKIGCLRYKLFLYVQYPARFLNKCEG